MSIRTEIPLNSNRLTINTIPLMLITIVAGFLDVSTLNAYIFNKIACILELIDAIIANLYIFFIDDFIFLSVIT